MPRKPSRPSDPLRLLGVLWEPKSDSGRSGLSVARLTSTAVAVADAEGLEAVTIRRVAEAASVGTMTMYTYVAGRNELIELMLDYAALRTYGAQPLPHTMPTWKEGLRHIAECNWADTLRHPWLIDVPAGRPVLGPGVSSKYESELAALDGIGLSDAEMDHALNSVLGLVTAAARMRIGLERNRAESDMTDAQWWSVLGPAMANAMGDRSFPIAARVSNSLATAGEPRASLDYGLRMLTDGISWRLDQSPLDQRAATTV